MAAKKINESLNHSYFHGILPERQKVGMIKSEFTTDDEAKVATGAIKYDGGKSKVFQGALDYFPRAIEAVADISAFGASKYAWKGWENVDDGFNRYSNALVRHITKASYEGDRDSDSGLLHAAHAAWNALARLEIILKNEENNYA